MRREFTRPPFGLALLSCLAALGEALAQSPTPSVVPTLSVRIEQTDNIDGISSSSAAVKRSDGILTVSPALELLHRGPNTLLEGRFGLTAEHRIKGTASDRVVPDGRLRLRAEPGGYGAGVEAALQAQQIKPAVSSSGGTSGATANTVTETQASVAPFFERKLSEHIDLIARTQALQARTDPRLSSGRETRTDGLNAQVSLVRRPAPLGYAVEASTLRENQKSESPGSSGSTGLLREDGRAEQSAFRSTLLYAFGQEIEAGLILGVEKDRRKLIASTAATTNAIDRTFSGSFWGVQATWRPGPRTEIKGTVEDRSAARTWLVDASHKFRRTTFSLTDRQVATRNAPASTVALGRSSPSQGSLDAPSTSEAAPQAEQASTLMSIQRTSGLRVTYEGVRSSLNLIAGQFRARALLPIGNLSDADRSRFHGAEVSYRLTNLVTPSLGLRWSHAKDASGLSRREQLSTAGLRVRLSMNSSFDAGVSRLSSRASSARAMPSEHTLVHSAFIRLEHRF